MKPLLSIIFCLLLSLGLVSCSSHLPAGFTKLSTSQMINHEGYSTVALVTYDTENDNEHISDIRAYCSAVWVDGTHILTAYHCVKSEQKRLQARQDEKELNRAPCGLLEAYFGMCDPTKDNEHTTIWMAGLPVHFIQWREVDDVNKEPTAWHLSKVVGWDEDKDLALLEAKGNAIPSHETALLASETPGLGETIYVCGHPKGYYWTFLNGPVAGYRGALRHHDKEEGPYLQAQVPVYFGNSGGGAFDAQGNLVGIADALLGLPAEGLFVHLDNIRAFLQDQNLLDKPAVTEESKKVIGVVTQHEEPSSPPKRDDDQK